MEVWVGALVSSASTPLETLSSVTASSVHAVQRRGWQEISIGGGEADDGDMEVFRECPCRVTISLC